MEDRRITKTKRNLKNTLISMLPEQPFEQISITELCARAEISRITFYSHYSDKYALVDEIFQDMVLLGTEDYERKQRENNPQRDEVLSYCNILDAIMELYYSRFDFFHYTAPDKNPYLAFPGDSGAAHKADGEPEPSALLAEKDRRVPVLRRHRLYQRGTC